MNSFLFSHKLMLLFLFASILLSNSKARKLIESSSDESLFQYHKGSLLEGKILVNLIWYGNFKPTQRAIVSDFIASFTFLPSNKTTQPFVATWWNTIEKYYYLPFYEKPTSSNLVLSTGTQILDENYSLGKSLTNQHILNLASNGAQKDVINIVLTSSDVMVEGFCSARCGTHGSSTNMVINEKKASKLAYIWDGNSETQCPGQCAWPFHQPMYGPKTSPLVAPNNDASVDGMVINLASLLAGTVTNPFGNGYYQGPKDAPLEASSACLGIYGKGAYPGYAGDLLIDSATGASYNAHGVNGRKYLLPALFDPSSVSCSTLV